MPEAAVSLKEENLRTNTPAAKNIPDQFRLAAESIENPDEAVPTKSQWNDLEAIFGTPLYTHEWITSCISSFCRHGGLKLMLVKSNDAVEAIAPMSTSGKLIKRLEIVGSSVLGEPCGFLYRSPEALEILVASVDRLKKPVYLKGFSVASEESRLIENRIRQQKLWAIIREERIPWVATKTEWKTFEKQISASRRSSMRRLTRLAESKGELHFEALVPSEENLDKYLEEMFEVEAASWKARTGTSLKAYQNLGEFFREYSRKAAKQGELRLFFLRVGQKAVAAQLTVKHDNRLWVFKVGYDETWSWCSPGILLMHHVIKYCVEHGYDACELLGRNEPWLHIWTKDTHEVNTYWLYPRTLTGAIAMTTDLWRIALNKIVSTGKRRLAKRRSPSHA